MCGNSVDPNQLASVLMGGYVNLKEYNVHSAFSIEDLIYGCSCFIEFIK